MSNEGDTVTLPDGTTYVVHGVIPEPPLPFSRPVEKTLDPFGLAPLDPLGLAPLDTVEKFNPYHDNLGRFTTGPGGLAAGPRASYFDSSGKPTIRTSNVDVAAEALGNGQHVVLNSNREVSLLLDKIAALVADAEALGEKAPIYDLCKVTVAGTNLFCAKSKGIPRVQMPQLKGIPTPGSRADSLPRDSRGEVTLTDQFRDRLTSMGVKITNEDEPAAFLKATQNELNGANVAGIAGAYRRGDLADERLFVSADNYIVDGHHRWASVTGVDLADGVAGDLSLPIARVDMPILDLLQLSNDFAVEWGIPQASVDQGAIHKGSNGYRSIRPCYDCPDDVVTADPFGLVEKYSPSQPRDNQGQWTSTGSHTSADVDIGRRTMADGGSTTNVSGKSHSGAVKTGKALSVHPERSRVYHKRMNSTAIAAAARRYRADHIDLLGQDGYALGTWLDDQGQLWLDVVTVVSSSSEAKRLARKHNQIAYFDIDTGTEVQTGGTGLAKRLHRWLNGRGSSGASPEDVPLAGRSEERGDRGGTSPDPTPSDPTRLTKRLTPREQHIATLVEKYNRNHHPAGSPIGGQFAPSKGGSGPSLVGPNLVDTEGMSNEGLEGHSLSYEGDDGDMTPYDELTRIAPKFAAKVDKALADRHLTLDELTAQALTVIDEGNAAHADWYPAVNKAMRALASHYNSTVDTVSGMLTVMAALREFGKNMKDTHTLLALLSADKPFKVSAEDAVNFNARGKKDHLGVAIPPITAGTYRPSELDPTALVSLHETIIGRGVGRDRLKGIVNATGTPPIIKAIRIFRGESPDSAIGGPKLRSFQSNVANPGNGEVTIDTWMLRVMSPPKKHLKIPGEGDKLWSLDEYEAALEPSGKNRVPQKAYFSAPGSAVGESINSGVGLYPVFAEAVRRAARQRGMTPDGAQAVMWEVARVRAGFVPTNLDALLEEAGLTTIVNADGSISVKVD